jgi:putative ABC transport system substrate-binding protein
LSREALIRSSRTDHAAGYVDRVRKGEKPGGTCQYKQTTKYETVISLRTGKALGLEVPATLLARADEVIE